MIPRIETGLNYILRFVGSPYKWGGDDPMAGFDCSGLALEFLKATAILLQESYDTNAQGLRVLLNRQKVSKPIAGALVFYGKTRATHVAICLDESLMIEAGGGNSTTEDLDDAIVQNAYVRVRPINRRADILGYADPFKEERR